MFTYDDILLAHARGAFYKAPEIADFKLFVGESEDLTPQPNIQLYASKVQPTAYALIEPNLKVENQGVVGDGLGVLDEDDTDFSSFDITPHYIGGGIQ